MFTFPLMNNTTPTAQGVSYTETVGVDMSSSADHTFSSVDVGAEDATRYIIVAVTAFRSGSTPRVYNVTVGGNTATRLVEGVTGQPKEYSGGYGYARVYIFGVSLATGTTADIFVDTNTLNALSVSVFRTVGLSSHTPNDSKAGSYVSGGSGFTLDVPEDGIVIVGAAGDYDKTTAWTGPTEDYDEEIFTPNGDCKVTGASADSLSADPAYTVTPVSTAAGGRYAYAAVAMA